MILDALDYGERLEKERLHLEEIAIAQLTTFYFNSQKSKPPYKNVDDFCFFKAKDRFSDAVCSTFRSLLDANKVPNWAVSVLPIIELDSGAISNRPVYPRLYSAPGIFLLCPSFYEDCMQVAIAAFDDAVEPGKYHIVLDVDNKANRVRLWLPQDALNYAVNVSFDVVTI